MIMHLFRPRPAAIAVAVMFLCLAGVPAADTGSVKGRVIRNGQPVAGVDVKLCKDEPVLRGAKGTPASGDRRIIVARTKTTADGRFMFNNIKPGIYQLQAGNQKLGWIFMIVKVEAGKTTDLGDLFKRG